MTAVMKCLEDFTVGDVIALGVCQVDGDALIAFATEFDPAAMHLGDEAARDALRPLPADAEAPGALVPLEGMIASSWHVGSLFMRVFYDGLLVNSSSRGAPGIERADWPTPVRPGDTLRFSLTVLDIRVSQSRPDMGLVRFSISALNQRDEPVFDGSNWTMFGRREAAHVV